MVMGEKRIYYKELPCFQNASEKYQKRKYQEPYFDLEWFPTKEIQQEIEGFLRMRGASRSMATILQDKKTYQEIQSFLQKTLDNKVGSSKELDPETWRKKLKAWMMDNGMPITYMAKSPYGKSLVKTERLILYFDAFLKYLEPEDLREEQGKDVWEVDKLGIKIKKILFIICRL